MRAASRVRLVWEHVEAGAGEASLIKRLEERGLVDQRASSDVHESRAGAHRRERGAIDQRRSSWFGARSPGVSAVSSLQPCRLENRSVPNSTRVCRDPALGSGVRRHRVPQISAAAVVIRPAKRNAVWRNDDSRSNGSSAETASRGITTWYQRSAALAAV